MDNEKSAPNPLGTDGARKDMADASAPPITTQREEKAHQDANIRPERTASFGDYIVGYFCFPFAPYFMLIPG